MYRIRHNILSSVLLAAALIAVSCEKGEISAVYEGDNGYAFASSVLYAEVSADDDGVLEIPVYRGEDGEAGQVRIGFNYDSSTTGESDPVWVDEDPRGVFSLLTPNVTFAENSFEAVARVRIGNINKLRTADKYRMKLEILEGVSPSNRNSVIVTVTKKLVFEKYGDCSYYDECIFENAYDTEIYKAQGEEIYRVMDPYREGLIAEEYAAEGWMGTPPDYVEFTCEGNVIKFKEFPTGMLFNKTYMSYAYYPSDYVWGRDFSKFDAKNKKLNDKHFQLCAVYCLPSFQYGYMNDGTYVIDIIVK